MEANLGGKVYLSQWSLVVSLGQQNFEHFLYLAAPFFSNDSTVTDPFTIDI